jgi:hypothetical protein
MNKNMPETRALQCRLELDNSIDVICPECSTAVHITDVGDALRKPFLTKVREAQELCDRLAVLLYDADEVRRRLIGLQRLIIFPDDNTHAGEEDW